MQKIALCFCFLFLLTGCRIGELTPEEKQKVADIKSEIEKIEKEIAIAEKLLSPGATGLIPRLQQTRLETDKLTVSILRQHAAAIESGSGVTTVASAINPDPALQASLEEEIRDADAELLKTKAESALYSGGLIKVTIDARASMQELTLASLQQKYLAAKYGLFLPGSSTTPAPSQPGGEAPAQHARKTDNAPVAAQEAQLEVEDPGPFDFRHVRWGMSREEVKQREKLRPVDEISDAIIYNEKILTHAATLLYSFIDNKLYSAAYILKDNQYSNKNNYVDAYEEIAASLTEKYGAPIRKNDVWSNNLYKNDYANRGMAYGIGHVISSSEWKKGQESIHAGITGNNFKITCAVIYKNDELAKEADAAKKREQSSKF